MSEPDYYDLNNQVLELERQRDELKKIFPKRAAQYNRECEEEIEKIRAIARDILGEELER